MKTFISTFLFFLVCISGNAQVKMLSAQTASVESEKTFNYVVLTKNLEQLPSIFMTAKTLAGNEKEFGQFDLVIYGEAVKDIKPTEIEEMIKNAGDHKLNLLICGYSLKAFKVNTSPFEDTVKIIDNAVLHDLQMQNKGFLSLTL